MKEVNNISVPSARIKIGVSNIIPGEIGVFSLRPIKKDEIVVSHKQFTKAKFFPWSEYSKLDSVTKKRVMAYCSGTEDGFCAPEDLNYISIAWHLNHSCNPNVGFDEKWNFVAMRNIKANEELTWDYAFDETNSKFKMKCSCGYEFCRKVITGNDWKFLINDKNKFKYLSPQLKKLAS